MTILAESGAGHARESRWVTFDCFGTLVDWRTGFMAVLTRLVGDKAAEVLHAYHRIEPMLEAETPHRLYADVLAAGLSRGAADVGVDLSEADARALPNAWGALPVFDDVEPMLAGLREMGCKLAVLTNCDEALFAETQRSFRHPFDLVVTAERVKDYKPSQTHFHYFARSTGAAPGTWVHVACSWFHDIAPARALGIPRVWLDRDRTGDDPAAASARIESAADVRAAVSRLFV